MAIRFMAPAHGLPAVPDAADSFFDEGIAEAGTGARPSVNALDDATAAAQHAPVVQPRLATVGQAALDPHQAADVGLDRQPATHAAAAFGSRPTAASLAQRRQQAETAQVQKRGAAAGMQFPQTNQHDDEQLLSAIGAAADSAAAEHATRTWLPAPGSETGTLRVGSPVDRLRTALASQQWATTAALPIDQRREALSSVSDEVSSLHSDAAGNTGQHWQAPQPMSIGFLGTAAAVDDAAAFEFASLTPGDEPGSPLAVGSWSTDHGSSMLESFRLPASSLAAVSEATAAPTAAARTAISNSARGPASAGNVEAHSTEPQLWSSSQTAAPITSVDGAGLQPASKPGVSAVSVGGTAQPSGPHSPRPPRSPARTQDGGPVPSAARAGVAKFRGWQSGKRSATGAVAAPPAQDGTTGRRDTLPPAHSTSLDRWLPPPAPEPPHDGADAGAAPGQGVQLTAAGPTMPPATAEPPSLDSPVAVRSPGLPLLAPLQQQPPAPRAAPSTTAAPVLAQGGHTDEPPSSATSPVVGSPAHADVVSDDLSAQPAANASERRHTVLLQGQKSAQSTLEAQLATASVQLAHTKADAELSKGQPRQRDGELAVVVERQGVREAEVAALQRQLEDVQKGAGRQP